MSYRIVYTPTPYQWARPAGEAGRVSWIAVHTPEGSGDPKGTVRYLAGAGNTGRVGYHEVIAPGVVYQLAPPHRWVGHAGVSTRVPGTDVRNVRTNYRTIGISIDNRAGQPPDPRAVTTAVERVADLIIALGLPDAGVVLGHRELTVPDANGHKRRSDPTGVSMTDFRARVAARLRELGHKG